MSRGIRKSDHLLVTRSGMLLLMGVWTLIVALAGIYLSYLFYQHSIDLARIQARESFNKDVVYRHWASMHGGVYVPVTPHTPPNPYLKHLARRDISTDDGQELTLVNPAYMTRQVHELGTEIYGHKGHITSLKPIRPGNAPDPWEAEALLAFDKGTKEISELLQIDGEEYLRLMRPLVTRQSCLKCHEAQGYKVGDIRGGISVSVPMAPILTLVENKQQATMGMLFAILLLGILGIRYAGARVTRQIQMRENVEQALRDNQTQLRLGYETQRIVNQLLMISLNEKPLLETLAQSLEVILTADFLELQTRAGIFLNEDGELRLKVQHDLPDGVIQACDKVRFGQCLCGQAAQSREIQFTSHVGDAHEITYDGIQPHGHYNVPILLGEEVIGVLVLYLSEGHTQTEFELVFLQAVANTLAGLIERKRLENKVRKLVHAVEQSPESIVITDLDARIEYVNQAFSRVTGYSREDAIGQNPRVLQSGHTPQDTYDRMWETLVRGESWKGEFVNKGKDGHEYTEFAIIAPIRDESGTPTHYLAIKEDISEKKRVGRELDTHRHHLEELVRERTSQLEEARVQAEAANRAKSAFLANMSHEIRTPMNAILGHTRLMMRSPDTQAEQQKNLAQIDQSASHLMSIINDILDISRIEAGRIHLESIDFDLDQLFNRLERQFDRTAHERGLALQIDIGDCPHCVNGDPVRLRQALLNYLSNAFKYTTQGSIQVQAKLLEQEAGEVLLQFNVCDTGIGIDRQVATTLFNSFVQADVSTTRHHGGTGLGLALTRYLAELMNGEVGVESEPGKGSRFWFTARLQLAKGEHHPLAEAATLDDAAARLQQDFAGTKLLLVDDHTVSREITGDLLDAVGLQVDSVETAAEATDRIVANQYALILVDVELVNAADSRIMDRIREQDQCEPLPVLALLPFDSGLDRSACVVAGIDGFITTPIDPNELYTQVLAWLAGGSLPEPLDQADDSDGAAAALLGELRQLLQQDDVAANAYFAQHEQELARRFGESTEQLGQFIGDFDYTNAIRWIDETPGR